MSFRRWVSQAIRPAKMNTPRMLMTKLITGSFRKMFTSEARIRPTRPMIRKLPSPDRSRLVA